MAAALPVWSRLKPDAYALLSTSLAGAPAGELDMVVSAFANNGIVSVHDINRLTDDDLLELALHTHASHDARLARVQAIVRKAQAIIANNQPAPVPKKAAAAPEPLPLRVTCAKGHACRPYQGRIAATYARDAILICDVCRATDGDFDIKQLYAHCDTCQDWDACPACTTKACKAAAGAGPAPMEDIIGGGGKTTSSKGASAGAAAGGPAPMLVDAKGAAGDVKAVPLADVTCPVGHTCAYYANGRIAKNYAADSQLNCDVCGAQDFDTKRQYAHCDTCENWDACPDCTLAQRTRQPENATHALPGFVLNAKKLADVFHGEMARLSDRNTPGVVNAQGFAAAFAGQQYLAAPKPLATAKPAPKNYDAVMKELKLNADELDKLDKNGFVVSDRLGAKSFGSVFAQLYNKHLPVYVGADPILHAWHRSFDKILEQFETTYLAHSVHAILKSMIDTLPAACNGLDVTTQHNANAVRDAALFLHVAIHLLSGNAGGKPGGGAGQQPVPRVDEKLPACAKLGAAVQEAVKAVQHCKDIPKDGVPFSEREFPDDMSMYTPRGHYTRTAQLRAYFQAMVWLGRADMILDPKYELKSLRDLASACVLVLTLNMAKQALVYAEMDRLLVLLFGASDNCSFSQLSHVMAEHKIQFARDLTEANVRKLWAALQATELGVQAINDKPAMEQDADAARRNAIRSIAMMGQRFTIDSFVINSCTAPRSRRVPSAVDVGFAVFDNRAAAQVIADRMTLMGNHAPRAAGAAAAAGGAAAAAPAPVRVSVKDMALAKDKSIKSGVELAGDRKGGGDDGAGAYTFDSEAWKFRDGIDYSTQLQACRAVVAQLTPVNGKELWSSSVQTLWLVTLRALSNPEQLHGTSVNWNPSIEPAGPIPSFHPWYSQGKQKATLHGPKAPPEASAGMLKHDIPQFMRTRQFGYLTLNSQLASWTELRHDTILYVKQGHGFMTCCDYPDGYVDPRLGFWKAIIAMCWRLVSVFSTVARPKQVADIVAFLKGFASICQTLEGIAATQQKQLPLTADQKQFLKDIILSQGGSGISCPYTGWFSRMFYGDDEAFLREEYLVADVFTNPKDDNTGDPGCVLHVATGGCGLMIAHVENGSDRGLYCGPVYTRYEFRTAPDKRLTDEDWKLKLQTGDNIPPVTAEQREYRVLGHIPGVRAANA